MRRIIGVEPYVRNEDGELSLAILSLDNKIADGNDVHSIGGTGTFKFPILPPGFKFKGTTNHDAKGVEVADADFLGYGPTIEGVCVPNYAPNSPWQNALSVDAMVGIASTCVSSGVYDPPRGQNKPKNPSVKFTNTGCWACDAFDPRQSRNLQ